MNFGLCLPSGLIYKDNEIVCHCDLINYDEFIEEINNLIKRGYKEGLYTYYENKKKVYEKEVKELI